MFVSSVFIRSSSFCNLVNSLTGTLSRTLVPQHKKYIFFFYPAHVVTNFGAQCLRRKDSSLHFGEFQILLCLQSFLLEQSCVELYQKMPCCLSLVLEASFLSILGYLLKTPKTFQRNFLVLLPQHCAASSCGVVKGIAIQMKQPCRVKIQTPHYCKHMAYRFCIHY
jgi:hypothetical protein